MTQQKTGESGYEEVTPIDRPLMRSDLNDIRQLVWNISERQLSERRNSLAYVAVCVVSMLVCLGCAVAGLQ